MDLKGFARFRTTRKKEPKFFDIEIGKINVDGKIKAAIENVIKKYGDSSKYGANAVKTQAQAVAVLLEQMLYARKGQKKKKSAKA
jgi:hypothetical protein